MARHLYRRWYEVRPVPVSVARNLIERYHYAKGAGNTGTCFGLFAKMDPHTCLGVTWWQPPPRNGAIRAAGEQWRSCLMLSRAVLAPGAEKNLASFLIGASIRQLRAARHDRSFSWLVSRQEVRCKGHYRWTHLVTYADEYRSLHPEDPGTIYWASNWEYLGARTRKVYVDEEGRLTSKKAGPHNYTHLDMKDRGCRNIGAFALHCFMWDFHNRREQVKRIQLRVRERRARLSLLAKMAHIDQMALFAA